MQKIKFIMNNSNIQGCGMDSFKLLSATIDLLRFPLAIMVIIIHMKYPGVSNLFDADFSLISGHGIYNVTGVLLSHVLTLIAVLTHIAVPTFYLISGFLFFINFQKWSWEGYKKKLSSRIKTLLVPYLLWNAIPFLLTVLAMLAATIKRMPIEAVETFIVEKNWHIFYDCNEWGTTCINWLGENLRMTGPYDLPLWFLRDLIVVTMMTPIIYYAMKKSGLFIICILFVAYISRIWTPLPGFSITAFFFFSTGAYFALNKINVIQFVDKYKLLFIPICIILLVATTILYDGNNTVIRQNIQPLFVCTGVFTAFFVASRCIIKYNIMPNKMLVSSCFFIYAIHGVELPRIGTPLELTTRVLHYIIPGNTGIEEGFCYIISPIVTAFLCILLLMFARRLFPKLTLYFSGNR